LAASTESAVPAHHSLSFEPKVVYLPFVDARARASFAASFLSGATLEHLPLQPYLSKPGLRLPTDAVLIEVEGDSMVPTVMPKDILLIAPVPESEWRYLSGGIYTVLYGQDHLVVKRVLQNTLATEGILRLISDNPTGGQIDLPGADISSIFRVLAVTRQL
jgi:phage repressor protein C with HTH and peptisase S24 domain